MPGNVESFNSHESSTSSALQLIWNGLYQVTAKPPYSPVTQEVASSSLVDPVYKEALSATVNQKWWTHAALLTGLAFGAYLPALNTGFIADDYVFLEWGQQLKSNIWFLFRFPPLN